MKRSMHGMARSLALLMVVASPACSHAADRTDPPAQASYLRLKDSTTLDSVPYVWERTEGPKHIVVMGTYHLLDPRSPMYQRMAAIFERVRPQLILHESTAPDDLATETRDQAIRRGADLGFTVQLARQEGILTESADAPAQEEMQALLARHPAADVFVYVVATRLVGSYRHPDLKEDASDYRAFFDAQIVGNGIPVQKGWETWDGFLRAYRQVVGHPVTATTWDPRLLDPTLNRGRLNDVARTSDTLRDRYLLAAIRRSLAKYDRVIVVFGADHVLALEPVLGEVLKHEP